MVTLTLAAAAMVLGTPAGESQSVPFDVQAAKAQYQRPYEIPYPEDNAYSKARAELGKTLFFDPRLSRSRFLSCASCHNPSMDWADGLARGLGHAMQRLDRRTPTLLNVAWGASFFWDGRAATLEEQALGPVESEAEMNMPLPILIDTIAAIPGYKTMFEQAYPGEGITKETVAKALATFQRGLVSGTAPFDRWVRGDNTAISASAQRGFELFNTKARCNKCHSGWRFTDDSFHDIGVETTDKGRGKIFAKVRSMQHAFKTPTLRNVDRRAPYAHNGSEPTLEAVMELYDLGGRVQRDSLSREMVPLNLTEQEKKDLVEFMKTLTSEDKPIEVARLPKAVPAKLPHLPFDDDTKTKSKKQKTAERATAPKEGGTVVASNLDK